MRNLRKLTAAILAITLVLTSMTAVFAADSATLANTDKAVTLKDLGLYSGQDANDTKVGLENALTTQDSLIFLAKLFGYNEVATKLTADQVAEALAKFDDAASISDYAKNVVAYSATNNILSGSTKDEKFFVGAKDTVTAARFATFMLKQMGYTVADYKESVAKLAETKGSKVTATVTGDLTRDDAVGVMYGALTAERATGKTVIADIVGDNADLKAKAEKLGLIEAKPVQAIESKGESGGSKPIVIPELRVVSVNATEESIQIIFNEELDIEVATNPYSYVLKRLSDNKEIPLSAVIDDSKKSVELKFLAKLEDNTEFELLIKKYKDISGNINASDYKYIFKTLDYKHPKVIDDPKIDQHCFAIAEKGKIFIIYSEAMNEVQMLDKGSYQVSIDQDDTYIDLGVDDTITKVNDRQVQIYVKELDDKNETTIRPYVKIAPIMDLAGNRLYGSIETYTVQSIDSENVHIEESQLITKNKIKVVFNKKMGSISWSDIELTNLTSPGSISVVDYESTTINSDGKTEVVLIFDKDLSTDVRDASGAIIGITTIDAPSSESEWGSKLRSHFSINLYDKTAPEIVKWDHDNDVSTDDIANVIGGGDIANPQVYNQDYTVPQNTTGIITITFSEYIKESTLTVDTFNVTGFTITNITAPAETKTVILTVKANADNTPVKTTVTQVSEIYDTADNAFVPGSVWAVTLEDKPVTF